MGIAENSWENIYYSDSTELGRQNSYSPTFKMCNHTLQLKYYTKIHWSCKKHELFTTCSTTQEREGTNFTPCFIKTCTHLGATCFHSDVFFTSKPSHFPLLNHCVTVNHWWSSAVGPKIGLGTERGWGRGNLSYVPVFLGLPSNSEQAVLPPNTSDPPGSNHLSLLHGLFLQCCTHSAEKPRQQEPH